MMIKPALSRAASRSLTTSACLSASSTAPTKKTGVLMLNMGGPQSLDEVEPFLRNLFLDRDIIKLPMQNVLGPLIAKRRAPSVQKKYSEIGGKSPIFDWTTKQGKMMCELLNKQSGSVGLFTAYPAFRYANPLTHTAIDQMLKDGVERVVAFSQYPQYSCTTSGSSFSALAEYFNDNPSQLVSKNGQPLEFFFIDRWSTHPKLVASFADNIRQTLADAFPDSSVRQRVVILFTAHSVPQYVMDRGDTYPSEVGATVELVMRQLGYSNSHRLVWQSKVGPLPWLKPSTEDAIKALVQRGQKHLLLVPIAFVNEHIETLHELDIEYATELGDSVGAEKIVRCPTPNVTSNFVECLADIVSEKIASGVAASPQLLMRCVHCTNANCGKTKGWLAKANNKAGTTAARPPLVAPAFA